jgi:hypothetical protein
MRKTQNTRRPVLGCAAVVLHLMNRRSKTLRLLRRNSRHPAGKELRVLNTPSVPPLDTQLLLLQADREIGVVWSPTLGHHRSLMLQLLLPRVDKKELTDLVRKGSRAPYPSTISECSIELWN